MPGFRKSNSTSLLIRSVLLIFAISATAFPTAHTSSQRTSRSSFPPTPNSVCYWQNEFEIFHSWIVYLPNQSAPSTSDSIGGNLLDNLRKQCGTISNWQAKINETDQGLATYFETSISAKPSMVSDAAWLASDPEDRVILDCQTERPPTIGLPHDFLGNLPFVQSKA